MYQAPILEVATKRDGSGAGPRKHTGDYLMYLVEMS